MTSPSIKCVAVGDGFVGKTCMLTTYATNTFPENYLPTIFDTAAIEVVIEEKRYMICLFDTAGQEEYDRLRPLGYVRTDVFLICYSVIAPNSFQNVVDKWVPEIRHHCPKTPYLLIGTKIDLRDDSATVEALAVKTQTPKSCEHGRKLAKDIGAVKYVECSSRTQVGLSKVFDEAIRVTVNYSKRNKKRTCVLL